MGAYVDYTFYKNEYLGNAIPEAGFSDSALRASQYVNYITFGRASKNPDNQDVKMAACAVAEVILKNDKNGDKSSESVGKLSVTYNTRGTAEKKMYSAAYPYLAHTGLLYRGVRK